MKKLNLLLLVLLFASCKTAKSTQISQAKQKDSVSYVERVIVDTLKIPGDKIEIKIPCDDLKYQSFSKGRAKVKVEPKGNWYVITASCDSIEKLLISKEKETIRLSEKLKNNDSQKVVGLTQLQSFWIVMGKAFMVLLIIILGWKFISWRLSL
jgi:hypothetical protein